MKVQMPDYFEELLADQIPPCVSIYLPTLRANPPAAENPRRLANLIREAEEQAKQWYRAHQLQFMAQFHEVRTDRGFWAHPSDGLALFGSAKTFQTIWLPRSVREMAEVADSFHLRPLIRTQQFTGRYQVLCLSPRNVRLYEGDRDRLEELSPGRVPASIVDATGRIGEGRPENVGGTIDMERFFRIVDSAVWESHSRRSGLPLILCADVHNHELFHRISRNPNLVNESIRINPEGISAERLREEAWKIVEPRYRQRLEKVLDEYGRAQAYGSGSDDLPQVAEAATFSRVGTLLVDADKRIRGRVDPHSGRLELGDIDRAEFDDVIDDIAEKVIKTGGQVLVMPHELMPSASGLAAIYRF